VDRDVCLCGYVGRGGDGGVVVAVVVVVVVVAVVVAVAVDGGKEGLDGVGGLGQERKSDFAADVDARLMVEGCMILQVPLPAAAVLVLAYSRDRDDSLLADSAVVAYYGPLVEHLVPETIYAEAVVGVDVDLQFAGRAHRKVASEDDG
jgi:hypothetical protein